MLFSGVICRLTYWDPHSALFSTSSVPHLQTGVSHRLLTYRTTRVIDHYRLSKPSSVSLSLES